MSEDELRGELGDLSARLDRLSDQLENGVKSGVDCLVGRRRADQWAKWVLTVASGLVVIGLTAAGGMMLDLKVSYTKLQGSIATSTAELQGSIDRLNSGLAAARELNDNSLLALIQRLAANEKRDDRQDRHMQAIDELNETQDGRLLDLERRRSRVRPQ